MEKEKGTENGGDVDVDVNVDKPGTDKPTTEKSTTEKTTRRDTTETKD